MRVLRIVLRLVFVRLTGQILRPQLADVLPRLRNGIVRNARRVSTHVGNQTHCLALDVDPFIQSLRHAHGAPYVEAQPTSRLLLQL